MTNLVKAALGLTSLSAEGKVVKTQSIKDAMQSSGNFLDANMPIKYAAIQTIITNTHNAVIAATGGTSADTSFMHEQERILVSAFNFIKAFVERTANSNVNPGMVITSAGMQVAVVGGSSGVTELTLDAIGNGKLQVRVPRGTDEKAFMYEYSTDNTTWQELTASSLTKVTLSNQTPGSTIYVRYYGISKNGKNAYSQAKSLMII